MASTHRVLRLTPDDWMAPLFGQSDAGGRRDILEGRMIWVAHEVLASGSSVVLAQHLACLGQLALADMPVISFPADD